VHVKLDVGVMANEKMAMADLVPSTAVRCAESSSHCYDFKTLLALPVGESAGVPEYFGPLDVAWVHRKGRGLVVARDVAAGELLFANRAFAIAEPNALPEVASKKLECCSKELFDAFFLLCDGQNTPQELPRLISSDQALNCRCRQADRARVRAILAANAHELDTSDLSQSRPHRRTLSALFLLGSLVNHSCRPTAARVFLGDMMFVRAARNMSRGEEITDGYISVLQPCFERRQSLQQRHGIDLCDDRAKVEDMLLPECRARDMLKRLDDAKQHEDFSRLILDVEDFVHQRMAWLGSGCATAEVEAAATGLGCGLERLLLGGLAMAAYVAVAALLAQMAQHAEAAAAYSRCCWLLEELAPHNAYHASWAVEALLEAIRGCLPLCGYIRYARKVLTGHCGPGALESALLARAGGCCLRPGDLQAVQGTLARPPGEVGILCELKFQDGKLAQSNDANMVEVNMEVDDPIAVQDLQVTASQLVLQLKMKSRHLSVMLPVRVRPERAGAVRLTKGRRCIHVSLPRDGA